MAYLNNLMVVILVIISDIQDYFQCIIKNETSSTKPPILICIYRINRGLVFKIKDRYKLVLWTPESMKLSDN